MPLRVRVTPLRLALVLAGLMAVVRFTGCSAIELIDARSVDYRLLQRGVQQPTGEVVIVAVDDASLRDIGRWPWSRAVMAELITKLSEAKPAVIGLDIVHSESAPDAMIKGLPARIEGVDSDVWERVLATLEQWSSEDRILADAIQRAQNVALGHFFDFGASADIGAPVAVGTYDRTDRSANGMGETRVVSAPRLTGNLRIFSDAALETGFFNIFPDRWDGLYRRVPMVIRYGETAALPLTLAMLRVARPDDGIVVRFEDYGVDSVSVGRMVVPVSEDGQFLVNYRGPAGTLPRVSAKDVLQGRVPPRALEGKLLIVGVTATAVGDIRSTPFDGAYPGVEIQATVIDNIIGGDFIRQGEWVVLLELVEILIVGLLLGLGLRRYRGHGGAASAVAIVIGHLAISQRMFVALGLSLTLIYPVLAIVLMYFAVGVQQFRNERAEKQNMRENFERYMHPDIARRLSESPELHRLAGDKREVSVLFSEIHDFGTLIDAMAPDELVKLLNEYLEEISPIVVASGGTLDRCVGNSFMSFWGAPISTDEHAVAACRAALLLRDHIEAIRQRWIERGYPNLKAGVAVHTATAVAGNMGSGRSLNYTIVGTDLPVAMRLERLTDYYGVSVLASEQIVNATHDEFLYRELDRVRLGNDDAVVRVYELLDEAADGRFRWLAKQFAVALAAYDKRDWSAARIEFQRVLLRFPDDRPSELYTERCEAWMTRAPTPQWDGVTDQPSC